MKVPAFQLRPGDRFTPDWPDSMLRAWSSNLLRGNKPPWLVRSVQRAGDVDRSVDELVCIRVVDEMSAGEVNPDTGEVTATVVTLPLYIGRSDLVDLHSAV